MSIFGQLGPAHLKRRNRSLPAKSIESADRERADDMPRRASGVEITWAKGAVSLTELDTSSCESAAVGGTPVKLVALTVHFSRLGLI